MKLHWPSGRRLSHRFNEIGSEYRVNWLRLGQSTNQTACTIGDAPVAGLDAPTCRKTLRQMASYLEDHGRLSKRSVSHHEAQTDGTAGSNPVLSANEFPKVLMT